MAINTLLTVFSAGFILLILAFVMISIIYFHEKRRFSALIKSYFESPDAETPSQFAEVVDAVSATFARRTIAQIKSTVMGMNSVDSKNATREAVAEATESSPQLAGLAALLPKRWVKPEILALAAQLLGNKGKPDNGNTGQPVAQTTFKL